MDQYNLEILSKKLKIASINIMREEKEVEILDALFQSDLIDKFVFYGGTALRLAYGSPRFSEDLDFLMIKNITVLKLKKTLEKLTQAQEEISLKDIKDKRNTLFALLNVNYSFLKHPFNIKIEIAKRKNGITHEYIPLVSPCSQLRPLVLTAKIESLEKLKKLTLSRRKEPRDWFDIWYIKKYLKKPFNIEEEFPFDKKEFSREMKRFLPQDKWILIDQLFRQLS